MSDYGSHKFTIGMSIRGARVKRIRANQLEEWGREVMKLEDENCKLKAQLKILEQAVSVLRQVPIQFIQAEIDEALENTKYRQERNRIIPDADGGL